MRIDRANRGVVAHAGGQRLQRRQQRARRFRAGPIAATIGATVPMAAVAPATNAAPPLPTPVMTGYVPLDADATQKTMENANSLADTTLDFTVGITNAGAGAVMYYDHWEDGFEADLTNPL